MASSDFRSALHHFPGPPVIGFAAPGHPRPATWGHKRRGRDGSLLFSDGLCGRSAPTTPAGSWVLPLQALRTVRWPSPSRSGLGSRSFLPSQACLRRLHRTPHRTDRPLARRPRRLCHDASTLGSPLAPATSYGAAWPLPRPDFHRQVHRRLQDTHRDSKFTRSFDEVFRSEGIRVIRTPVQAPEAKAHAERWVGSLRRECLDRILIVGQRQLEQVVRAYIRHHNEHRPHRSLEQRPPLAKPPPRGVKKFDSGRDGVLVIPVERVQTARRAGVFAVSAPVRRRSRARLGRR